MLLQVFAKCFPRTTKRKIERRSCKSLFWVSECSDGKQSTLIRLTWCSALPDYTGDIHTAGFLLLFPSQEVHHILSLTPKCPPPSTAPPVLKLTPIWAVSQRLYPSPDQQDKDWADWRSDTGAESSQVKKSSVSEGIMGDGYLGRWPAGCVFVIVFEECVVWI